ncbi:hypothetical protein FN846DRAFT_893175 [Sphaerosporella brunnea]|uniref:Uncharacterized protein n=1 Tax=Sphaerosporella brunnea TaxID=1250544 RepID=A0A5J5ELK6_9PEZI|nr:hypothetical protein FN846DRAFT_893175 [Sphaerosporella brunnea]
MAHLLNAFDTRTKTHDWMTLLAYLHEQVGPEPNLKICTKPVTYTNGHVKQAYLDAVKGTPEFSDNCHTLSTALKEYSAKWGTVFIFIVNLDLAVEKKSETTKRRKQKSKTTNRQNVIQTGMHFWFA